MDDTAGEGDTLGVVLGGAGEHFGGEILELDGLGDSTWFVEAVHVEVVIEEMEVVGKKKEGLYRLYKISTGCVRPGTFNNGTGSPIVKNV